MTAELEPVAGGPKSEGGKVVARWNATRHGIRSPSPVVPGVEKARDWEDHRDGVLDNLSPSGHLELTLAERVALLSWRLHRVTRYETETISLAQAEIADDLARRRRISSGVFADSHPEDALEKPKELRRTENLLDKLPEMPDGKKLRSEDAANVLEAVAGRVEKEELVEGLDLPGVPEWAGLDEYPSEWDGWTVEVVRACLRTIAEAAGEDLEELLEGAREETRLGGIQAKNRAEEVKKALAGMTHERLLPDDKTLEKISRYEAHLSRQLFKALHELEALQVRRSGGTSPLARIDVNGGVVPGD
jgi:hypothetical protein